MVKSVASFRASPAAAGVYAAVAFSAMALAVATINDTWPLALMFLLALIALPFGASVLWRRAIHPLEPLGVFLVCYAIAYVLKPVLDHQGFITYEWFRFDGQDVVRGALVSTCALIVVYVGYFSTGYRVIEPLLPRLTRNPSLIRTRTLALALTFGGVIAIVIMTRNLGRPFLIAEATAGGYRNDVLGATYGRGYLILLCTWAAFAPGIQLFAALSSRRIIDWLLWLTVTGAVAGVLAVLYSRQLFLQAIVLLLVVAHFRAGWFGPRTLAALGISILVLGGFLGLRVRDRNPSPLTAIAFLGHTFDSFEFLGQALTQHSPVGELGGQSIAEDLALTYVPRSIFPEKPEVFGIVRVQNLAAPYFANFSVRNATFPPGFLVEGYLNMGLVGVVLMALAYGVGLRVAREWFWPRQEQVFALIVYGGLILNMTGMFRSAAQFLLQVVSTSAVLYLAFYARIPVVARHDRLPATASVGRPH